VKVSWKRHVAPLVLVAIAGCKDKPAAPAGGGPPPAPVTLTPAVSKAVPIELTAVGSVLPIATVSVKAQVAGPVMSQSFEEGQLVKAGDELAVIDSRPILIARKQLDANLARTRALITQAEATKAQREADVRQVEALLSRGNAQAEQARRAERRTKALAESELVAAEDFDRLRTETTVTEAGLRGTKAQIENAKSAAKAAQAAIDAAKATEAADLAAIEQAELQLSYTTIKAPISGRVGARLVPVGNLIKANDETLVVITQVAPIHVAFSVPESYLAAILAAWPGRDLPGATPESAPAVEVYEPGGARAASIAKGGRGLPMATGRLSFINNTVDVATGTVLLKATFESPDGRLWPGQFVDVALRLSTREGLTVPSQAVQTGQQGQFVFVVGADKTADVRPVVVERHVAGDALIAEGLKAGERVVIDGQAKVRKGAPVRIPAEEKAPPAAAPAPASKTP
jgi:multidrug efflux system membrane fusion protein